VTDGQIFMLGVIVMPFIIFMACVYGDYREEGKWPWTKKRDGTNSGAKFG